VPVQVLAVELALAAERLALQVQVSEQAQ